MTDSNILTNTLSGFANAYAGLLGQLTTIPQIAKLDAYSSEIVNNSTEAIASNILADISANNAHKVYEEAILKSKGAEIMIPELWDSTAQSVNEFTSALDKLEPEQKIAFLSEQGVDVTAPNLQDRLAPKITEWLTAPDAALTKVRLTIKNQEQGEAAKVKIKITEQGTKEHDLQDSVAAFIGALLTAAKGTETTITRDDAAALISAEGSKLKSEGLQYLLNNSADNFAKYSADEQKNIVLETMRAFAKSHGKELTDEALKDDLANLQPQDIAVMVDRLKSIPCPEVAKVVVAVKGERAPVEKANTQRPSFTERVSTKPNEAELTVQVGG